MKQTLLTIAIAILALGGALVAVFYLNNSYQSTIQSLSTKAISLQSELNQKDTVLANLQTDLTTAQTALNETPDLTTRTYFLSGLNLSFDYPAEFTANAELAEDVTQSPGGMITLQNNAVENSPIIRIMVNPPGSGFEANKLVTYLRVGSSFILNSANEIENATLPFADRVVVAQLPLADSLASETQDLEQGLTIFYQSNGASWNSEIMLYDLVNSMSIN